MAKPGSKPKAKPKAKAKAQRPARGKKKGVDLHVQLLKILGTLALLILLVVSAAVLAYYFLGQPSRPPVIAKPPAVQAPESKTPAPQAVAPRAKTPKKPAYEVFKKELPPPAPPAPLKMPPGHHLPVVAIIIDDIGHDRQMADQLLQLDAPLTFSILPYARFSRQIISDARAKGKEVMLHLPMEPNEYPQVDPGAGALLSQMTPDQMIDQLNKNLDMFTGLKGVNNHMGSRLSTSPERMRQIFTVLKKRGLFYIDSRTTAETVARMSAEKLHVPFAERDVFIDHINDPEFMRSQLDLLIQRAHKQGYAVGIGHPHANTYRVLAEYLPILKEKVRLAPASMVIQTIAYAEANGKSRAHR
jgi:uncharacterized protein